MSKKDTTKLIEMTNIDHSDVYLRYIMIEPTHEDTRKQSDAATIASSHALFPVSVYLRIQPEFHVYAKSIKYIS